MSRLDELIKELCPNGVEYKSLIDVADVLYGYPCDAKKFNEEKRGIRQCNHKVINKLFYQFDVLSLK